MTLEELIAEGESDELEFKSTLRWDIHEGVINKKLEEVAINTVAAFANSQGGTLLIGVDDSGQILGLEHDYSTLGGINRDKFEVHLRNIFNQYLGVALVTSKIQIKFHQLDEKDVCQIEVNPANKTVVVELKDKNGQSVEVLCSQW